jgi:hypothetical protein
VREAGLNWPNSSKLGCAAFVLVMLIMAAIYWYAFSEADEQTPTPTAPPTAVG